MKEEQERLRKEQELGFRINGIRRRKPKATV